MTEINIDRLFLVLEEKNEKIRLLKEVIEMFKDRYKIVEELKEQTEYVVSKQGYYQIRTTTYTLPEHTIEYKEII